MSSCSMNTLAKPCPSCPWRVDKDASDIPHFRLELAVGLGLVCLLLGRWRACAVWPVARLTGIEVGDTITVTSWSGRRSARILLGGAIREVLLLEGSEPYAGDFVIRAIRGHQLSVDGVLSGAPAAMPRRRTG